MDELTEAQLDELRRDLVALRDDLGEQITVAKDSSQPVQLDQAAVGRVSRIDAIQVQQMAKANLRALQLRLEQTAQALRMHERNDYGYCRACDEPIGYRRLKAKPESPLCLNCQSNSERRR